MVAGGANNQADGDLSFVAGGNNNRALGGNSAVIGGWRTRSPRAMAARSRSSAASRARCPPRPTTRSRSAARRSHPEHQIRGGAGGGVSSCRPSPPHRATRVQQAARTEHPAENHGEQALAAPIASRAPHCHGKRRSRPTTRAGHSHIHVAQTGAAQMGAAPPPLPATSRPTSARAKAAGDEPGQPSGPSTRYGSLSQRPSATRCCSRRRAVTTWAVYEREL